MSLTVAEELELIQLLEEEEKYQAKTNYYEYVKYTHGRMYAYTRHGEFICKLLDDAVKKRHQMISGQIPVETQYFMLSVPPQHGKSMHVTETFPSFFLGNFPNEGVIEISYNETFAEKFGGKNKDKINQYGKELFGVQISKDTNAKGEWEVTDLQGKKTRGGMISRGIMSGVTGSSFGDCIIIDDPIKNREEANSEVIREKHWDEWKDSLSSRIHPGAIVILIMTRWHEDDLWGRLQNPEYAKPRNWKVYNIPLEAEENDHLGRVLGEPIWIEKYGYDFIEERKAYPSSFNSLYQGRPTAQEGNLIKRHWWNYYDILPVMGTMILSVDASFKDTSDSAKCSIQVWGKANANLFMIDNFTAKMDFTTALQAIRNMLNKYPEIRGRYVEDKANGTAIINVLSHELGGFIAVKADATTGGKEARAQAITPWIQGGNAYLPRQAAWVHDFVEECASFPNGKYADQVDAMSQAMNELIYRFGTVKAPQPDISPEQRWLKEQEDKHFREAERNGRKMRR